MKSNNSSQLQIPHRLWPPSLPVTIEGQPPGPRQPETHGSGGHCADALEPSELRLWLPGRPIRIGIRIGGWGLLVNGQIWIGGARGCSTSRVVESKGLVDRPHSGIAPFARSTCVTHAGFGAFPQMELPTLIPIVICSHHL